MVRCRILMLFACLAFLSSARGGEVPDDPIDYKFMKRQKGIDVRLPVKSRDFPFSAIGRVITDEGACTGQMVGRYLVATNAHCICKTDDCESTDIARNIRFHPNYHKGSSVLLSESHWAWWGKPAKGKTDWAIVRLRSPLGDQVGYLGYAKRSFEVVSSDAWEDKLMMTGYPIDADRGETPILSVRCSVTKDLDRLGWQHDCDSGKGSSGSALVALLEGKPYIIGLHWGTSSVVDESVAVPTASFFERLREVRRDDPQKYPHTTLHLCNFGVADDVWASIAYSTEDEGWVARGHYAIKPGTCRELPIPGDRYTGDVYVFGFSGRLEWRGKQPFAWSSKEFAYRNADHIPRGGTFKLFNKTRVEYDKMNTYAFYP